MTTKFMDTFSAVFSGAMVGVIGSLIYYIVFKLICRGPRCRIVTANPILVAGIGLVIGAVLGFFMLGR